MLITQMNYQVDSSTEPLTTMLEILLTLETIAVPQGAEGDMPPVLSRIDSLICPNSRKECLGVGNF